MIIGYIYKTTILNKNSSLNNHYYIGKHCSISCGKTEEEAKKDGYFGSGSIIRKYIKKNGTSNLFKEILKFIEINENVEDAEESFLNLEFDSFGNKISELCLNLKNKSIGFGHGNSNIMKRDDIRQKSSISQKISQNKPEVKEKQIASQKSRWKNPELRKSQSDILKNNWRDSSFTEKVRKSRRDYYDNPQNIQKISQIQSEVQNRPENRGRQSGRMMYCLEFREMGLKYAYEWREKLFPLEKSRVQSDMHQCCAINEDRITKNMDINLRKTKGYTFSYI